MNFLLKILNDCAPVSYFILIGWLVASFLFFQRFFYLHRINIDVENFLLGIKNNLKNDKANKRIEAIAICDETSAPVASMAKSILSRNSTSESTLKRAAEEAALLEIPRLQRNARLIAAIGQLCPLLGFFGTVLFLLDFFRAIPQGSTLSMSISDMAPFIVNALNTTAMGISVAMIIHLYNVILQERCQFIVSNMEKTAMELINFLVEPEALASQMNEELLQVPQPPATDK